MISWLGSWGEMDIDGTGGISLKCAEIKEKVYTNKRKPSNQLVCTTTCSFVFISIKQKQHKWPLTISKNEQT